jgi:hypothetical protein
MHFIWSSMLLTQIQNTSLLSTRQISTRHPAFTEASIRWLIFRAADNGLERSGAIMRLGRKVLIDEALFVAWARSQGNVEAKGK